MRLRNSFWAGLTGSVEAHASEAVLDGIRVAMLQALGEAQSDGHLQLDMSITFAPDIDSLWELRVRLRSALAERFGDEEALVRLNRITEMFVGHHPAAKKSRFFGSQLQRGR